MKLNPSLKVKTAERKKARIVFGGILFFLASVIAFGYWYWDTNKNKIIENELEKAIVKTNNGFYKVSYDDMKVNESAGALTLLNMKVRFDSVSYQSAKNVGKIPPMVFNINIPEINVVGVKTKSALLDKEIIGRKLNGTVKLLYEDLKVALLEKDKGAIEMDKKFVTSLLANLVIKNSNPKGDDEARVQQVSLTRDTNRSLFYLCWKTIFTGIKETVGIKQPAEGSAAGE